MILLMDLIEIIKIIIIGIVEGITEWLPVSSTGHMLLVNEFMPLNFLSDPEKMQAFSDMFFVVIQLGAILAVIVVFWKKIFPFQMQEKKVALKMDCIFMWTKVVVACLPAAVGLFIDDFLEEHFGTPVTISIMLIVYGIIFIIIESGNKSKHAKSKSIEEMTYLTAFLIGVFQVLAMIPGTSRSGATIVGALILGMSRVAASEFTFFLAIPTMFAASFFKIIKFGFDFSSTEILALVIGMVVAFVVSILAIKFLMSYIKKHDFKAFGWYRIALGLLVLGLGYFVFPSLLY